MAVVAQLPVLCEFSTCPYLGGHAIQHYALRGHTQITKGYEFVGRMVLHDNGAVGHPSATCCEPARRAPMVLSAGNGAACSQIPCSSTEARTLRPCHVWRCSSACTRPVPWCGIIRIDVHATSQQHAPSTRNGSKSDSLSDMYVVLIAENL